MKQRGLIYEVGRYGGKVGHTQHGIVDAHAVPRHLRVAGRRAAESNGGERGASVTLDEHGRLNVRMSAIDKAMFSFSASESNFVFCTPISFIGRCPTP